MPDLLTGIALQRAIAERKGWREFHIRSDGDYGLVRVDGEDRSEWRRIAAWHSDVVAAHALLAELVEAKDASKRWRLEILIDGKGVSMTATRAVPGKDDIEWREVDADCDNAFCVAAGNLWLRCGQ